MTDSTSHRSGTYGQGIRATELRLGEEWSTAVATGLTANRFGLVNGFYIPFGDDRDDITTIVTRAMALLSAHGQPVRTTDTTPHAGQEPAADHLADTHTVLRVEETDQHSGSADPFPRRSGQSLVVLEMRSRD